MVFMNSPYVVTILFNCSKCKPRPANSAPNKTTLTIVYDDNFRKLSIVNVSDCNYDTQIFCLLSRTCLNKKA